MCCDFLRGKNGENLHRIGFQFYRKTNAKMFIVTHTAKWREKNYRRIMHLSLAIWCFLYGREGIIDGPFLYCFVFQTTTLHVHYAFLYISLLSLNDYDVKVPNFTFCEGHEHKTTTYFFFSWTSIQSNLEFNSKRIANIWRIEPNGISALAVECVEKFDAARIDSRANSLSKDLQGSF